MSSKSDDHQVHYASFGFHQVLFPHLQIQSCALLLKMCFGRLPANLPCVRRKSGTSRKRWILKSCIEQVLPGSVRNQRPEYRCLMSNSPRHKSAVLPVGHTQLPMLWQWCEQDEHLQHKKTPRLLPGATAKTAATVPNISKDTCYLQCCSTTYLFLLLWETEIEECLVFGMSVVSEIMKTNPEYILGHLRFWFITDNNTHRGL